MDFKKYDWRDFMDFDDTTEINKFNDGIAEMQQRFAGLQAAIDKSTTRISDSLHNLSESAGALLKNVNSVSSAQADSIDVMNKAATSTAALAAEAKALRDMESENAKQAALLKQQLAELNKLRDAAKKSTESESGSLRDLKKNLIEAVAAYEQMGDATDDAIKSDQKKKVEELAAEFNKQNKILNDAKKFASNAAGSYNDLSARVAAAKKELKTLEGAFDGSNPRVKELSKFVSEGTEKLKDFDESIGDNTRNVGNYKSALEAVIPGFGGVAAGIETATAAGKVFIASPIGWVLAGIAAALALVATYFKRTDEGGDKLAEILTIISEVFGVILDVAAQAGKVIFDAISEPKKLWSEFMDLLEPAKDLIIDVFTSPVKYIKELGQAILDNVINRFKAFGVMGEAIVKLMKGDFKAGFKQLTDGVIQVGTGVTNATDKIAAAADAVSDFVTGAMGAIGDRLSSIGDSIKRAAQLAKEIAALEDAAGGRRIENIKLGARIELESNELIRKSKDKLRISDEERFRALKREGQLQEILLGAELDAANKVLTIARKRIEIRKLEGDVTDDLLEAEANAIKGVLNLQARAVNDRTARQKREIQLVKEVEAEMLARIKRERDAQAALDKFLIEDRIRVNNLIISNEEATLDQILTAITANGDEQQALLNQQRDLQLAVAQESALARIELSEDQLSTIYNNEKLSLAERLQQERDAKMLLLGNDEAFADERAKIDAEYFSKLEQLNTATANAAEHNVFKILARDAERLRDSTEDLIAEGLIDLNAEFQKGEIGAEEYQRRRLEIQQNGQRALLETQLDFLEAELKLYQQYGHDATDLERQISETRLALSDQTTGELLAKEQKLQQALSDLRTTSIDTAATFAQASFEREDMALDERLAKLQERQEIELELAGDNEEQKSKIKNEFAQKERQIEADRAANARRAAVFDKISAIFSIGINTGIAVSKAIAASPLTGGLPFSAIVAALGALQIASVLAKPIPAYAEGTMFHPGGLALFAEAGGEIVESPGGKQAYYDEPTIAWLQRGSKVYKADQTQEMIMANSLMSQSMNQYLSDNDRLGTAEDVSENVMYRMLSEKMDSLEYTVAHKKEVHININKHGIRTAIADHGDWTEYLNKNYF